ncbi:protein-(glutamine-N5) methyltransferase, release factor-specific [[Eubacterium] yurii subsp. margaretiae ATCC 43715]|nr:protein-(glutamine-N5) methyltransferase, release factor-specific [[Eubacterium] yurii subsp. margaretiae ATCC 43715]
MTIREIYSYCINELESNQEKFIDTELLLSFVLKKDRIYIKTNLDEKIALDDEQQIKLFVQQLKNHKPIHYIIGQRDFYGYDFLVDEHVLIPRSDTEILVENAVNLLKNKKKDLKGLEIGVGSGIISITLLKKLKNLSMTAVDINDYAIDISKKNAENLGVSDRLKLIKSDLFENVIGKYDFIISNPPYIDEKDMADLPEKVKNYEPYSALDGKKNGMYFYNEIIKSGRTFLNDKFHIFFEIGYNQGEMIRHSFENCGYEADVKIIQDYGKNDRVAIYEE